MNALIQQKAEAIMQICREFNVARLELFGTASTPEFDPRRSDLDFLVTFLPGTDLGPWLSRHFELEKALASVLARRVHLVMESALRNQWFRREAQKTQTLIYDASKVAEVA